MKEDSNGSILRQKKRHRKQNVSDRFYLISANIVIEVNSLVKRQTQAEGT